MKDRKDPPSLVLAIDPGDVKSALVLWDGQTILYKAILENELALKELTQSPLNQADILAIELIKSYGMAVSDTIFTTCIWTGRFYQYWIDHADHAPSPAEVVLVPRLTIKMHLTHRSTANDSNVRQAIIDRLGPPGTVKAKGVTYGVRKDEWAALALALYYWDTKYNLQPTQLITQEKRSED